MTDDPAEIARRTAWLQAMRAQGRPQRLAGFVACLVGVVVLVAARYRLGGAIWGLWSGVAAIGVGWALFVYALARRLYWARAHPYESNG